MHNSTVIVSIKNVYGKELIYPVNELGKKFLVLTGRSTLTHNDIRAIKELGFKIEVEQHKEL